MLNFNCAVHLIELTFSIPIYVHVNLQTIYSDAQKNRIFFVLFMETQYFKTETNF